MLNNEEFDLWSDEYDRTVALSDEEKTYPFAGYTDVLEKIFQLVTAKKGAKVLDIGFGTGALTAKLYEHGCEIWGQDFSQRMVETSKSKMPDAHLFQGDFSQGLKAPLLHNTYDFIIATYSLHHLTDDLRNKFIRSLFDLLKKGGFILIGDIAFFNWHELEQCKEAAGDEWDDEEVYFVFDELQREFPKVKFEQISHCAGVFSLMK